MRTYRRSRPDRRGSSGRFALRFCFGDRLAGVLFGSLGVDVGTHRFPGCAADTANEVRPMPEKRLFVERSKVFSKAVARSSGAGRLEVVDENRNIKRRMDVGEQVDVVWFTAEFDQRAAPGGGAIGERVLEVVKQFR